MKFAVYRFEVSLVFEALLANEKQDEDIRLSYHVVAPKRAVCFELSS